jgi:hypothetical protein
VFIVGHSMVVRADGRECRANSRAIRGGGVPGGGGGVKASDALKKVPFFVGVGQQTLPLPGPSGCRKDSTKAGVEKVVFRAYEHLNI